MKRFVLMAIGIVGLAAIWFFALRFSGPGKADEVHPGHPDSPPLAAVEKSALLAPSLDGPPEAVLNLAGDLNAPDHGIQRDLQILDGVFAVWRTNFLRDGNPVGDNAEITAALTGRNRLHVAFLIPHHPAINAHGELCDRWGTPFFFHQLSGTKMEIRSAGPDRKRGTDDDVLFTP